MSNPKAFVLCRPQPFLGNLSNPLPLLPRGNLLSHSLTLPLTYVTDGLPVTEELDNFREMQVQEE